MTSITVMKKGTSLLTFPLLLIVRRNAQPHPVAGMLLDPLESEDHLLATRPFETGGRRMTESRCEYSL